LRKNRKAKNELYQKTLAGDSHNYKYRSLDSSNYQRLVGGSMARIKVKTIDPPFWADNHLVVVANGLCNHADYDFEDEEFIDNVDFAEGDIRTSTEPIIVCRKCKAWRYANDYTKLGWQNETIFDEPVPVRTTKELVLR
jgi:hypothetical protein